HVAHLFSHLTKVFVLDIVFDPVDCGFGLATHVGERFRGAVVSLACRVGSLVVQVFGLFLDALRDAGGMPSHATGGLLGIADGLLHIAAALLLVACALLVLVFRVSHSGCLLLFVALWCPKLLRWNFRRIAWTGFDDFRHCCLLLQAMLR